MKHKARILVVDDEESMLDVLSMLLERSGYSVDVAESAEQALVKIAGSRYDLILSDLNLPGLDGLSLMRSLRSYKDGWIKRVPVILITGYGTTSSAVEAMKEGAADYILKPFDNDELLLNIERTLSAASLRKENVELRRELRQRFWFENLVGNSDEMMEVYGLIQKVKDSHINCLVYGESGTGKELVAQSIHHSGERREGPFVAVNCGAIPENLIESELFGHKRGAFTGALRDKEGYFQAADGGTLFLDEVGEMPLAAQVKLLRAIAERKVSPVGSVQEREVDVRIVAATNKALSEEVAEGRFREDLYYRLNVVQIDLPPLRERSGDIDLLANHFLRRFAQESGKRITGFTEKAWSAIRSYDWPGNVRELRNAIEGAVALESEEEVGFPVLPRNVRGGVEESQEAERAPAASEEEFPESGVRLDSILLDMERQYLQRALQQAGGNKTEAARLLGMTFRSFRYRLAKYDLEDGEAQER